MFFLVIGNVLSRGRQCDFRPALTGCFGLLTATKAAAWTRDPWSCVLQYYDACLWIETESPQAHQFDKGCFSRTRAEDSKAISPAEDRDLIKSFLKEQRCVKISRH